MATLSGEATVFALACLLIKAKLFKKDFACPEASSFFRSRGPLRVDNCLKVFPFVQESKKEVIKVASLCDMAEKYVVMSIHINMSVRRGNLV